MTTNGAAVAISLAVLAGCVVPDHVGEAGPAQGATCNACEPYAVLGATCTQCGGYALGICVPTRWDGSLWCDPQGCVVDSDCAWLDAAYPTCGHRYCSLDYRCVDPCP